MASVGTPKDIYLKRLAERRERAAAVAAKLARIHYLRLAVFLGAAVSIWLAVRGANSPAWIALPVALFILLVASQSRLERDAECLRRAALFHERGIARLDHQWQSAGETGERFADPHHPYAADLDLFGRAGLFQLLSVARTRGGEARLAAWLKSPASVEEIRARQEAVAA